MSVALYFVLSKIPRTIKRAEWRDIWRWKRVTQKKLNEETQRQYNELALYGSTMHPKMKADLINSLVYPPLLLGPYMDTK